jgi:SAM-dependent methyltransferase
MGAEEIDWASFNRNRHLRPARELLQRTLGCIKLSGMSPGVAVDLGCGSGAETLELLKGGWTVHAVDAEPSGLATLVDTAGDEFGGRLHVHQANFEEFVFPPCDLVWAGYSLPFCAEAKFPDLWASIVSSLRCNGRFVGDFFGDRHAFAGSEGVLVLSEAAVRAMLAGLSIESFDIEDGVRPSGGAITRWHAFGVAARKPKEANH